MQTAIAEEVPRVFLCNFNHLDRFCPAEISALLRFRQENRREFGGDLTTDLKKKDRLNTTTPPSFRLLGRVLCLQLWKRTKDAGAFRTDGDQERFTTPQLDIPDMAAMTLAHSQNATSLGGTQAVYRYEFSHQIGVKAHHKLSAFCLFVDWKNLPEGSKTSDTTHMGNVSLLVVKPCM